MSLRKSPIFAKASILALLLALLAPAGALWAEEPEATQDTAEAEAEAAEVEAEVAAVEAEPKGSPGMRIPLDGESTKSFEKSLKKIEAETTPAEFTTLQNALDYLLVYDLAARGNPELLYQRLDGKTPNDVLEMVLWRQEGRPRQKR